MKFVKIQGVGNDYIYIKSEELRDKNLNELAIKLSNRRFGIGGDGLITVDTNVNEVDAEMRIFNADGSEAKMCGNGVRGVSLILSMQKIKPYYLIKTACGIKRVTPEFFYKNYGTYKVNMGKVEVMPKTDLRFRYKKKVYKPIAVDVGNRHAVFIVDNEDMQDFAEKLLLQKLNEKYNLEVVKVLHKKEISAKFVEKGSGITLSCGTGACASVTACIEKGLTENHVVVKTDGGILRVSVENGETYLTGESVLCYKGEINI